MDATAKRDIGAGVFSLNVECFRVVKNRFAVTLADASDRKLACLPEFCTRRFLCLPRAQTRRQPACGELKRSISSTALEISDESAQSAPLLPVAQEADDTAVEEIAMISCPANERPYTMDSISLCARASSACAARSRHVKSSAGSTGAFLRMRRSSASRRASSWRYSPVRHQLAYPR